MGPKTGGRGRGPRAWCVGCGPWKSNTLYSLFPNTKFYTFFLIIVKIYLENKVIGFQFEPESSISNHEGFYQDSSVEGDAMV